MKKIIAILLMLACAFTLIACGQDDGSYAVAAADFITAINDTQVTTLTATVSAETAEGVLTSKYTTTYNADGSSTMTYEIDTIPGLDSAEDKEVLTGTVTCDKDGNYSDGGAVSGKLGAKGVSFDADSEKITNFTVNGDTLTVTVAAADTEAVLGYAIPSDAVVVVTKAEGKVISITLSYTEESGAVSIVCAYN